MIGSLSAACWNNWATSTGEHMHWVRHVTCSAKVVWYSKCKTDHGRAEAVNFYKELLSVAEQHPALVYPLAPIYGSIAITLQEQRRFEEALLYFTEELQV